MYNIDVVILFSPTHARVQTTDNSDEKGCIDSELSYSIPGIGSGSSTRTSVSRLP